MAKKKSGEHKEKDELHQKRLVSFIISDGTRTVAAYGPINPEWDGKPTTLRAIIDSWTQPVYDRDNTLNDNIAVWYNGKILAVMREFPINNYEVLVFNHTLLDKMLPNAVDDKN